MANELHKTSLLRKVAQVGGSTLLSRFAGIIREVLMVRYLGAGVQSDAFLTAFKIPNSLRKIFAEGALSAALIPSLVSILKRDDKRAVSSIMTLSFLVFEGVLLGLCLFVFWQPEMIIRLIAPGWYADAGVASLLGIPMPGAWFGYGLA